MSNLNVNNITPLAGTTGTVSVSGSLFVSGSITANGHITLGNEDTDSVSLGAEISSSIIPDATDTYNLGSAAKNWNTLFANTISGSIETDTISVVSITASGDITSSGNLYISDITASSIQIVSGAIGLDVVHGGYRLGHTKIITSSGLILQIGNTGTPLLQPLELYGNITSSYNISASENVTALNFIATGSEGNITMSGDLTSSFLSTGSFGEFHTEGIFMNNGGVTGEAEISGAGDLIFSVGDAQDFRFTEGGTNFAFFDGSSRSFRFGSSGISVPAAIVEVAGDITTLGPSGSITASQAISASAGIIGLNLTATGSGTGTGSFNSATIGSEEVQVGQTSLYVTGSVGLGNLTPTTTLNVSGAVSASDFSLEPDGKLYFDGISGNDFIYGNADGQVDLVVTGIQKIITTATVTQIGTTDNNQLLRVIGAISGSDTITGLNIVATGSGNTGTGSFNSVEIGQHGTSAVTQVGQQSLYVTGSVSLGNETASDPLFTLNVSGGISASGDLIIDGTTTLGNTTFGTGTVTINGTIGEITASGVISGSGFHMPNTILPSKDATHLNTDGGGHEFGHKFTVQGQMQAAVADGDTSGIFTVGNNSINQYSVIMGNISGDHTLIGGLSMSSLNILASAGTASFTFTDAEGGEVIADDTPFTASFAILGTDLDN